MTQSPWLLNADKTEPLWFGPASQLHQLPSQNNTISINQCFVKPVTVVRGCQSTRHMVNSSRCRLVIRSTHHAVDSSQRDGQLVRSKSKQTSKPYILS